MSGVYGVRTNAVLGLACLGVSWRVGPERHFAGGCGGGLEGQVEDDYKYSVTEDSVPVDRSPRGRQGRVLQVAATQTRPSPNSNSASATTVRLV